MNESETVKVLIRIRPDSFSEKSFSTTSLTIGSNTFQFDRIFGPDASQEEVFGNVEYILDQIKKGYNATIFAYGNTSSGKSYTMFGSPNNPGIIPRICSKIFDETSVVKISFFEIYQERLQDLFRSETSESSDLDLRIRTDPIKGVYIQGLTEKYVNSPEEILSAIRKGAEYRITASTALNNVSSRSHAILTITLTRFCGNVEIASKINLIDLAGSENVGKSQVTGTSLNEAKTINKSLSCLGNVINALTEKGRDHIPYRDSKLTYILQDSLGGNAKTIVIATLLLSQLSESLNTLRFATRLKEIKNKPKVNETESVDSLKKTIAELRSKIQELEHYLHDDEEIIQTVKSTEDNKELVMLRMRSAKLKDRISEMKSELSNSKAENKEIQEMFEKQRALAVNVAKRLFAETMRSCSLRNEVEHLKMTLESLKEMPEDLLGIAVRKTDLYPSFPSHSHVESNLPLDLQVVVD